MVLLLLFHLELGFHLFVLTVVEMVVVQVLNLLHVRDDLRTVITFLLLHLSVEVLDFGFLLLDLSTSVVIEIVDHVLLNLEHVTLHLCLLEARTETFYRHFELIILHFLVMIIGLNFVFGSLLLLFPLLSFSSHMN